MGERNELKVVCVREPILLVWDTLQKILGHKCMVTAVSGFIEQVGSMIREFQNTIIIPQLLTIPSSFKVWASTNTCQLANLYQLIGTYPVQNWIIASRWMQMNWYLFVVLSRLALWSLIDCEGDDGWGLCFNLFAQWACSDLYWSSF